jgi:hypothetical protein
MVSLHSCGPAGIGITVPAVVVTLWEASQNLDADGGHVEFDPKMAVGTDS